MMYGLKLTVWTDLCLSLHAMMKLKHVSGGQALPAATAGSQLSEFCMVHHAVGCKVTESYTNGALRGHHDERVTALIICSQSDPAPSRWTTCSKAPLIPLHI